MRNLETFESFDDKYYNKIGGVLDELHNALRRMIRNMTDVKQIEHELFFPLAEEGYQLIPEKGAGYLLIVCKRRIPEDDAKKEFDTIKTLLDRRRKFLEKDGFKTQYEFKINDTIQNSYNPAEYKNNIIEWKGFNQYTENDQYGYRMVGFCNFQIKFYIV
jgi:hypothetical protein